MGIAISEEDTDSGVVIKSLTDHGAAAKVWKYFQSIWKRIHIFLLAPRVYISFSILFPGWKNQNWDSDPGSGWWNCCGLSSRKGASELSGVL